MVAAYSHISTDAVRRTCAAQWIANPRVQKPGKVLRFYILKIAFPGPPAPVFLYPQR